MFELMFDNTTMPMLEQVMAFSERRQEVLNYNVANINTPGFRQTDAPVEEFVEALNEAIDRRDNETPGKFEMRSTRNIKFGPAMEVKAKELTGLMNYYDGGDRSVEQLQNEMLKNAMWHQTAAKLFSHQSKLLETAIRGQVR